MQSARNDQVLKSCCWGLGTATYILPVRNVIVRPIFWFKEVCRRHITGRGSSNVATSLVKLRMLTQRKIRRRSMQWPPGINLSQLYANGVHSVTAKTVLMMKIVTINAAMP